MLRRRRVHIGMTSRVKRQAPLFLALAKAHPHVCKAILRGQGPSSVPVRVRFEHSQRQRGIEA